MKGIRFSNYKKLASILVIIGLIVSFQTINSVHNNLIQYNQFEKQYISLNRDMSYFDLNDTYIGLEDRIISGRDVWKENFYDVAGTSIYSFTNPPWIDIVNSETGKVSLKCIENATIFHLKTTENGGAIEFVEEITTPIITHKWLNQSNELTCPRVGLFDHFSYYDGIFWTLQYSDYLMNGSQSIFVNGEGRNLIGFNKIEVVYNKTIPSPLPIYNTSEFYYQPNTWMKVRNNKVYIPNLTINDGSASGSHLFSIYSLPNLEPISHEPIKPNLSNFYSQPPQQEMITLDLLANVIGLNLDYRLDVFSNEALSIFGFDFENYLQKNETFYPFLIGNYFPNPNLSDDIPYEPSDYSNFLGVSAVFPFVIGDHIVHIIAPFTATKRNQEILGVLITRIQQIEPYKFSLSTYKEEFQNIWLISSIVVLILEPIVWLFNKKFNRWLHSSK